MNKKFLLLIIIPNINAFCEAQWQLKIFKQQPNITEIDINNYELSEPVNAISSLSYTVFGLIGMALDNYTTMYYLVMSLSIFTGIGSFLHHYYYYYFFHSYIDWPHSSDIISMNLLATFTLLYITADNEYFKYKIINRLFNLVNILVGIIMLISIKLYYPWVPFFEYTIYGIIASQFIICFYFCYIKSNIKRRVFLSLLWNLLIFASGYITWIIDKECPEWMWYNRFNGHAIWHVLVSWALFNTINITNVSRYTFNQTRFTWKPLFISAPWFLYVISLSKEKSNIADNYTNIDTDEIRLLIEKPYHRRNRTVG